MLPSSLQRELSLRDYKLYFHISISVIMKTYNCILESEYLREACFLSEQFKIRLIKCPRKATVSELSISECVAGRNLICNEYLVLHKTKSLVTALFHTSPLQYLSTDFTSFQIKQNRRFLFIPVFQTEQLPGGSPFTGLGNTIFALVYQIDKVNLKITQGTLSDSWKG